MKKHSPFSEVARVRRARIWPLMHLLVEKSVGKPSTLPHGHFVRLRVVRWLHGKFDFRQFLSPIIRASRTSLVSGSEERHHNRLSREKVLVLNGWK